MTRIVAQAEAQVPFFCVTTHPATSSLVSLVSSHCCPISIQHIAPGNSRLYPLSLFLHDYQLGHVAPTISELLTINRPCEEGGTCPPISSLDPFTEREETFLVHPYRNCRRLNSPLRSSPLSSYPCMPHSTAQLLLRLTSRRLPACPLRPPLLRPPRSRVRQMSPVPPLSAA